jgi:hypothetical protein
MEIGSTYRAMQAVSQGRLELAEKTLQAPGPGKVRIRVEAPDASCAGSLARRLFSVGGELSRGDIQRLVVSRGTDGSNPAPSSRESQKRHANETEYPEGAGRKRTILLGHPDPPLATIEE